MGTPRSTSILLTWSQSSQEVVDKYTLNYRAIAGCGDVPSNSVSFLGRRLSYLLASLQEATQYEITVSAVNIAGASPASTYRGTTLAAVPRCCVPSPISQSVGPTSITVMWQREACLLRNGQPVHYSVRYRESASGTIIATATVSLDARTYTASPLFPRTSYTFEVALVNEVGTGPYRSTDISTSTPTNIGLFLGGVGYPNNSVVTLTDIGEDAAALLCITDRVACCRQRDGVGGHGRWTLPGEFPVDGTSAAGAKMFYRTRGTSSVLLHRRNVVSGPTGVFTCTIPDSQDKLQQVFVGIYPPDAGLPLIASLTYNITSGVLTCASTGGPASSITWSRSGPSYQQSQRVVDTSTATYHNLLSIFSSELSDYGGSFSCSVNNSRGQSPATTMTYQSSGLSGQQTSYPLGSSASVTCFSNLTVQFIQWLNASSTSALLVRDTSGLQQLVLLIEGVTSDINNTRYTCEVSILLPTGTTVIDRQNFTLNAGALGSTVRSPTSIMVTDTTSSRVTVQWMFEGPFYCIHKETCVVMYGTTEGPLDSRSSAVTAYIGHRTLSIALNSLAPATDYNYVIQCRNEFDNTGVMSAEMAFRTSDSESGPVERLATSPSDSTLVISWSPPALPNGVITSFLVRISDLARGTDYNITRDGEVTHYTTSGLVAGVPYNVSVAAVNRAGPGRLSFEVVFTRELEPNISPKNTVVTRTSGSVMTVSWIRLTLSEARGFITHYTVVYFPSSSGSKQQDSNTLYKIIDKDTSKIIIKDLDGSTAYAVQVSASTAAGAGDYSGTMIASIQRSAGGKFGVGPLTGVAVVAVVSIIVIFVVIIVKRRRSVLARIHTPTCNTDNKPEHGETELEDAALNETPVASGAALFKQPQRIGVNQSPEHGIIFTSSNVGIRGGQEGVEGNPCDGINGGNNAV